MLASAFLLALAATLFFSVRTVVFIVYWADPAHQEQGIQGWMTPGYVAHSWNIPQDLMRETLGPSLKGSRPSLKDIAAQQGIPLSELIARIEAMIAAHQAAVKP